MSKSHGTRDISMVQSSLNSWRSDSWTTEAGEAETIGTKEPPNSTTLPRTPTVSLRRITAKKITRPDTSTRDRRWNTRPRLTSIHKQLIKNPKFPPAKQERRRAPNPSSGSMVLASGVKRKDSRRRDGAFFGSGCVASGTNSPSSLPRFISLLGFF
jgi:hypothetical protein